MEFMHARPRLKQIFPTLNCTADICAWAWLTIYLYNGFSAVQTGSLFHLYALLSAVHEHS